MFRLHFATQYGMWVIQFLKFGLFWVAVRDGNRDLRTFCNLVSANDYLANSGIRDHYDEYSVKGRHAQFSQGVRA